MTRPGGDEPLYTISIAARLVRRDGPDGDDDLLDGLELRLTRENPRPREVPDEPIHPQTLRMYERLGLVAPQRVGKNRLYSDRDIERVRQIQYLTQRVGVNLAGVDVILTLLEKMERMQREMETLRGESNRGGSGGR